MELLPSTHQQIEHLSPLRNLMHIRMKKVLEENIMNKEVRNRFEPIEVFITQRTWKYILKEVVRDNQTSILKKVLGAWIYQPRKAGRPHKSSKHNLLTTICTILPELDEKGMQWTGKR